MGIKYSPFQMPQGCGIAFGIAISVFFLFPHQSQAQRFVAASSNVVDGTCRVKKALKILDEEPCKRTRQTGQTGREIRSFYTWPSGSKTVLVERDRELKLNGKSATKLWAGGNYECLRNNASGNTFCFTPAEKQQKVAKPLATKPQPQPISCEAYTDALKQKARAVSVALERKDNVAAGQPIGVSIRLNGAKFAPDMPAYLMVATMNDVRFNGRGFLPLPGGTSGPAKLGFAKEKMRAVTPLHARHIPQAMIYEIKPYKEGAFSISWAIVANTPCGEKLLTNVVTQKYVVSSGASTIVVQDVYDYSRPNDVIISNNGRYKLVVFDKFYQVFDLLNGTKILDRRGMCPDFSPTSRFVAALAGNLEESCAFNTSGKTQPKFEVIDLVSSEPVARVHPPALWAYGDAFLVVKAKWWKMLQGSGGIHSLLTDDGDPDREFLSEHIDSQVPAMSIEDGLLAFGNDSSGKKPGTTKVTGVYSMINGRRWTRNDYPDKEKGEIQDKNITEGATTIAANPAVFASHLRYIKDHKEVFGHIGSKAEVNALVSRQIPHKQGRTDEILADLTTSERDGRFLTAALTRAKRNPIEKFLLAPDDNSNRSVSSIIGDLLQTKFVATNQVTVFSKYKEIDRINKLNLASDDQKRALLAAWNRKMVASIKADLPNAAKALNVVLGCWPGGDILLRNISGAWRYKDDARIVWLVHANCQAMGTVGNLVINHLELFIKENGRTAHFNLLSDDEFADAASKDVLPPELKRQAIEAKDIAKTSTFFGALRSPSGKKTSIARTQQALIGYKPLSPSFHSGRYLFIPIGSQLFTVDLANKTLSGPRKLGLDTTDSVFFIDADGRNYIHLSADGRFGIFAVKGGEVRLRGRYVDDEIVVYDRNGYFLATHEGGQYVHFRFKGRNGLYSLSQFARHLKRPDYIMQVYQKGPAAVPPPKLSAPPRLFVERIATEGQSVTLQIDTRSYTGLKELKIFRDGFNILNLTLGGTSFSQKITLSVPAEARWLSVVATDQNGFESITKKIRLYLPPSAPEGRLFALAVGTDTYDDKQYLGPLNLAIADAKTFLQAARSAKGRYYSDVVTYELLDAPDLNAELITAVRRLVAQAGPKDTIMLHIAGHGLRDKVGQFYLAGKSTRIADLPNTAVLWSRVGELLEGAKSKVVVFLDACHAGAADESATNDDAAAAFLNRNGSIALIAASKGRQFSEEDASLKGGVFTASLRQALTTDRAQTDLNGNNAIELSELYGELKRRVVELTEGRQTPWIARNQMRGEVPLF